MSLHETINEMASWMAAIWGRKDAQQMSRNVIVGLRHQLQMIEKKEEYLLKKVEEEMAEAKANAMTNKPAGMSISSSWGVTTVHLC
jgi:charged multivesicular body protein 4